MIHYLCPMYRVILLQRNTIFRLCYTVSCLRLSHKHTQKQSWIRRYGPWVFFPANTAGFHCAGRLLCCAARESPCIISRSYISIFCPPCIWWMQWEVNYGGGIFYLVELREMVLFSREKYYTKRKATNKV